MCIIVDINVARDVLVDSRNTKYSRINDQIWNSKSRASIVHGGKLTVEYSRVQCVMKAVNQLDRAGKSKKLSENEIKLAEKEMSRAKIKSDDLHILAIAKTSKARVLCSNDKKIKKDFKNKDIVSNPQGCVYSSDKHDHLIREHCKK